MHEHISHYGTKSCRSVDQSTGGLSISLSINQQLKFTHAGKNSLVPNVTSILKTKGIFLEIINIKLFSSSAISMRHPTISISMRCPAWKLLFKLPFIREK